MFYMYDQNNSGGSFDFDEKAGIAPTVIIEANDNTHADERAKAVGLYFNGVSKGRDCPCCGDRWYPALEERTPEPTVYGKPVAEYVASGIRGSMHPGKSVAVHYLDGRVEWY